MIFDVISLIIVIGLALRGLRKGKFGVVSLTFSLIVSAIISGAMIPIYMRFLNLPKDIPAGIISFIITFIFTYFIISAPTLILSVVVLGSLTILILGLIVSFLPPDTKNIIINNSKVFPVILPLILKIRELINF